MPNIEHRSTSSFDIGYSMFDISRLGCREGTKSLQTDDKKMPLPFGPVIAQA
jgi:hypothetical protein